MLNTLPRGTFVNDLFTKELPKRHGIWKIKRPYRVVARIIDETNEKLIGYILYDRRTRHSILVTRAGLIAAAFKRQVKQLKLTADGLKTTGDLWLEGLPYHVVRSREEQRRYETKNLC